MLLLSATLIVGAAAFGWQGYRDMRAASASPQWFAGYVDVTATPYYTFEQPETDQGGSVILAFIVAHKSNPCVPAWGGEYTLAGAASELDLDRRIARLVRSGGEVSVSFGGQLHDELSSVCADEAKLIAGYRQVIDRYGVTTIDVDVEGEGLADAAAGERRARAMAALQKAYREQGQELKVWLTLPVDPRGLTAPGVEAVEGMLLAGVDLAGVNIMTMDYGASREAGQGMLQASIAAAESTHDQLDALYRSTGTGLGRQSLWRRIGLTPMIGQNDVAGEIFDLEAAEGLNAFALERGIGRLSMWSLNRDFTCSANYADVSRVSDRCSGIDQGEATFAEALGSGFATPGAAFPASTPTDGAPAPGPASTPVVDDPATSPYPIWFAEAAYVAGDRVVWHGNVYAAKWWTKGNLPDDPVKGAADASWQLIGPVLPGDRPVPPVLAPAGTYPQWSGRTVYTKGERVLFQGRVFEAKWWTEGDSPEAALQGAENTPWEMFSNEQVRKLLKQH